MKTRTNEALRLEEEITNAGVPLLGNQVPPLEKYVNDGKALINPPLLKDEDVMIDLFQMAQAITTQAQPVTTQAQSMTAQVYQEVVG